MDDSKPYASDNSSSPEPKTASWSLGKRIGFRFLAIYFLLYTLPFPLDAIPWVRSILYPGVVWIWQQATMVVAVGLLDLPVNVQARTTGSGDTTFDYVRLLALVLMTVFGTYLWSRLDRRRKSYPRAARWLVVGCRLYLGLTLLRYGFAKVIPTQFSTPNLNLLLQTYGSSSPMRLAWTFMGFSPTYTIFAGLSEVFAGSLLFFRRTRLLGACSAAAVMLNVVMINFCFDVPVKLFSLHLLAMAVGLCLLDGRRLAALFLANRPAPPAELPPLFESPRRQAAGVVGCGLLVLVTLWTNISYGLDAYRQFGGDRPKAEIWGIHDVETFRLGGEELPPLLTDEVRWKALVVDYAYPMSVGGFERSGRVSVQHMDGKLSHHNVELDEDARTLTFESEGYGSHTPDVRDILRYELPEPGRMVLSGTFQQQDVEIELLERDLEEMLLISRGFHWINETPFNR